MARSLCRGLQEDSYKTLTKYAKSHESFSAVASGSQAISRSGAATDPVLVQLMAPYAVESVVAALQKRKGVGRGGVSSEILQAGGSAAAVKLAEIHERVILKASWPFSWAGGRIQRHLQAQKGIQLSATTHEEYSLMSLCGKPLCKMLACSDFAAVQQRHARHTVWCDCSAWSRLRHSHPCDTHGRL